MDLDAEDNRDIVGNLGTADNLDNVADTEGTAGNLGSEADIADTVAREDIADTEGTADIEADTVVDCLAGILRDHLEDRLAVYHLVFDDLDP